ncbi:MAG TPA: protein kinase [Gemmatimonadales bacterium]|nr:protein kinase [Gemmatimonadales bacterium]
MPAIPERLLGSLSGRYRIDRELGRGGMAIVFLAHDLRHDRPVALKVLQPEIAAAFGPERFLREIRLTAQLDHPNILALLDSGEADGLLYYVMPYVEGESLRDRLQRERQLPLEQALAIARQVAGALDYAHRHGIVHRDIKPENILLVDGHARVADFGIARPAVTGGDSLTQSGVAVGTPTYMSPEQATGAADVDSRSDIYSLACVVYEMLGGSAPFTGPTPQAVLLRKLQEPMPSLRPLRPSLPATGETAIRQALAVTPADRPGTALEFVETLARDLSPAQRGNAGARPPRRRLLPFAGGALLVLAAVAGWWILGRDGDGAPRIRSLVILPLDNLTGDSTQAYFVDGMHEALTAELSQISALKVISRTSALQYRRSTLPAPQIARELGVEGLLEGSVSREGDRVRITVQLIHGPTDRHLWARQFDRDLRGVLQLQTEMAQTIAAEIEATVTPQERSRLAAAAQPVNPQAFELYLLGRHQFNQRGVDQVRRAVETFRRAVASDPEYGPAHAALGDAYLWLAEQGGMPQRQGCAEAGTAIMRAVALNEKHADAQMSMAMWQLQCAWNWPGADRAFQAALAVNPGSALVHQYYGRALARVARRFDVAVRELERARELDPLSVPVRAYLGQVWLFSRQYDRAVEVLEEALEENPGHVLLLHNLGEVAMAQARWSDAVEYLEPSVRGPGEQSAHYLAILAAAYARAGRGEEARRILTTLDQRAGQDLVSPFDMALVHLALGADAEALDWLERGYALRDVWLLEMTAWPWFDALQSNPRFQSLLRRIDQAASQPGAG